MDTNHRPSPGSPSAPQPVDAALLEKVRALLAKAESTAFDAEAEAFTAKAQQLMARHAIDAALVAQATGRHGEPTAVLVPIDDPYVPAKSLLLQTVALASRCRAVFHADRSASTLVGDPTDVAGVQLLYTSLLVQAQAALAAAARHAPPGTRPRSRAFRSSFLLAFTDRIGQRLAEINAYEVARTEAEQGRSLVPALAAIDARVDDAVTERFGAVGTKRLRGGSDAAGWARGRVAADQADIGQRTVVRRTG